jgi:acetyl-CoA carboxylase biotin carboxylase subunit
MFSKILIANRGEIAVRIIRACRDMGIKSVAVFSEADADNLHVSLADESVCIGEPVSSKSYLNMGKIFSAAKEKQVDAIHPGYGYLAENCEFANACIDNGFVFIGPNPENLKYAGDKVTAKKMMESVDIPTIPSSKGGVSTLDEASDICDKIGYPVMLKASAGGGGRGMRVCADKEELVEEFMISKAEARAAFGNDAVYIEKCIKNPRHIEFQVLADKFGNIAHLGERECTIQRRFQKLLEEAPAARLLPELRERMGHAAISAAKVLNYFNAGTVEFLVDSDNKFYFIEINARIQVEHPVTELTTGVDLVKEQIRLSSGEVLGFASEDINIRGCAIECRINAEDPEKNFMPSPGTIEEYFQPSGFGVRVDTHIYKGYQLPVFYDSLLAKLITYGLSRDGAISTMQRALYEYKIEPIKTTISFHKKILDDPDFKKGNFDTGFINRFFNENC